jgi:RNA methyltransferase, TrmH family
MLIKSKVKYIQSLSHKKLRDEEGVFVAEGPKIVEEMLRSPNIALKELLATEEWLAHHNKDHNDIRSLITEIDSPSLERISFQTTPNQVLGIFKKPTFKEPVNFSGELSLVLDTIQDPGNMGTIIRCADWFGIKYVICSRECADPFSPKVVQSSMGSIGRVRIIEEDPIALLTKHSDIAAYAAALDGMPIEKMEPVKEGFIIIGNESKGISDALKQKATKKITISRKGGAESLNAAVATGIILSHLVK